MYLNRTLELNKGTKDASTIAEMDFAKLPEPKVLLGAPGSGKTTVCRKIAKQLGGQFAYAEDVANGLFDDAPKFSEQILVIDGLDEVFSEEIPKAFVNIIKNSKSLGYTNWLINCRAYEWQSSLFEERIKAGLGKSPMIAGLGELSDEEIKSLLEIFNFYEGDVEQFLKDAETNEANEFLRNPQTLEMLVKAVQSSGWPKTKTELFRSACKIMALEYNESHQSEAKNRPTEDEITEIAGWICAQMLMSGKRTIALDGKYSEDSPRPADLSNHVYDYDAKKIEATCKTKLFKTAGKGNVEPVHRTVAEFLAGRWLAEQFKADPRTILPRRVMNSLTFGTEIISPSLRGLHAWITSLDVSDRLQNIKRDPYGCLRYGDLSEFSNDDLIALLEDLVALTQIDPFFQGSDWNARFGHSLGRASIKEKFVEIISDANTSPHLKFTLLQAIQGTKLAKAMVKELKAIVLSEDDDQFVRRIAVNALAGNLQPNDWLDLAEKLLKCGTMNSLEISLDQIISREHVHFSGAEIAEHSIAYEKKAFDEEKNHIAVMKHEIPIICSDIQVAEIAKSIAAEIPAGRDKHRRDSYTKLEEWLVVLFPRLLKRNNKPTVDELWPLISRLSYESHKFDWEDVPSWFAEHDDIRREIQARALDEGEDVSAKRMALYWLRDISTGLDMGESDVIHHLKRLIIAKDRLSNWQSSWEVLIWWIRGHDKFDGSALKLAKKQAEDFPELKQILEEVMNPPISEHEAKSQEIERQYKEEALAEIEQRHANFSEVREKMEKAEHLVALREAAIAVLGHCPYLKEVATPKERIVEMVGQENVAYVIKGFEVAVKKGDIPSVRECAYSHVNESKVKDIELISLAFCILMLESGKSLTSLPEKALLCALSASWSGWGYWEKLSKEITLKLEEILFEDNEIKLNFVKDIIEPSLEVGEEHISGFYRITTEYLFSDILPDLSIEWLARFEGVSDNAIWQLLKVAVRFTGDNTKFAKIIETQLQNNSWVNDEQRYAWHAAAFAVDFDRFYSDIDKFAGEDKDSLWAFKSIAGYSRNEELPVLNLNVRQISFLLETFARKWPFSSWPSGAHWINSKDPWHATDWLNKLIMILGEGKSKEAVKSLQSLADSGNMDTYQDLVQHSLANAKQGFAEAQHSVTTLEDVRKILSSGMPVNASDLQTIFIEEMERYEDAIQNGKTSGYSNFWEGKTPLCENRCRDKIVEGLKDRLKLLYDVDLNKESAMKNETRVDLLLTCGGNFALPVEIKGQWNRKLWTAARDQLQGYSDTYETGGVGVYLVIWHDPVKGKPIPKPPIGKRPESAEEMRQALHDNLGDLSPKTKILVLDVSKPERNR